MDWLDVPSGSDGTASLMTRLVRVLLAVMLAADISACASVKPPVKPWEREILAKRVMQLDADPTEVRIREAFLSYREGSTGALGSKGGGCGCD